LVVLFVVPVELEFPLLFPFELVLLLDAANAMDEADKNATVTATAIRFFFM
jgi:hypothetical protein